MAGEWRTLGDVIVEFRGGASIKTSEYSLSGTPVLTKGDVKPYGRVEHGGKFVRTEIAVSNGWRFSRPGDLIVTTRDLTLAANFLGLVSRVPKENSFVINQGATIFRIDESKIDPRYLVYWCCGPEYRQHIQDNYVGSTQIHIRNDDLLAAPLKLIPLPTQRAIAHILGTLDDKIELNRRMNATLEAMARALFQSWFVDFDPVRAKLDGRRPAGMDAETAALFPDGFVESAIGPVPKGWRVERFDAHITADRGLSYNGEGLRADGTGLPMHNLNSIYEGGGYKHEGIKYYAGDYREKHLLEPGDMIVTIRSKVSTIFSSATPQSFQSATGLEVCSAITSTASVTSLPLRSAPTTSLNSSTTAAGTIGLAAFRTVPRSICYRWTLSKCLCSLFPLSSL
jgi:type I restriction enzyme S subunit